MMRIGTTGMALLFLAWWSTGCSQQDFTRPLQGSPGGTVRAKKPRPSAAESPSSAERTERLAQILSRWNRQSESTAKDYIIGPGDELDISIYALEAPDQTTKLQRTATKDGVVNLPWIDSVDTTGLTVRQLEDRITKAYADRFIKNPQVAVEVSKYRSVAVVMTGAVKNPGIYYLNDNRSTLLEMLAKAGGLSSEAADDVIIVRGDSEILPAATAGSVSNLDVEAARDLSTQAMLNPVNRLITISLADLIDQGNMSMNVDVTAGTIITVRSSAEQYVYVLGYVQRPGSYLIKGSQQLDALQAVALAGGLSITARADNSFLVRETTEGQVIKTVNLTQIARGKDDPVYMEPGDTLVVGSSTIARLSEFVRPSVGAGMSLAPVP